MTTNPTSTPETPAQSIEGRSVREIAEHTHEMVSEPWCRRIFRQLLQSLEVQYGMRMPHRRITPDTILILDAGDPMLLPDGAEPAPDERIADDLRDLAAAIHYAITLELIPAGPLRGRAMAGYSDSFLGAIDRCMAPDPEQRPRSIEELRNMLGIVVLGPPAALTLPGDETPPPARITEVPRKERQPAPAAAGRRWLLGLGGLVVLGLLIALALLLRQSGDSGALPAPAPVPQLAQPTMGPSAQAADPAEPLVTLPQPAPANANAAVQAPAPGDAAGIIPQAAPGTAPAPAPPPTAVQLVPRGTPAGTAIAGTTYKLVIQPWGSVVVDGIERGASPPLKHLTLPPGEHTIRFVNPSFPEHTVTVQSAPGGQGVIELDFTEEKTP